MVVVASDLEEDDKSNNSSNEDVSNTIVFKKQKKTVWEGVERIPIKFTQWDGNPETLNKQYHYIQRQKRKPEDEEEDDEAGDDEETNSSLPPSPGVLLRLIKNHPNLFITRGLKGSKVYDHDYASPRWWKQTCDEIDKIIAIKSPNRLSLSYIHDQKRTTILVITLTVLNGVLIYLFGSFVIGNGGAGKQEFLGISDDIGVGVIFIVLVLFLIYGLARNYDATRRETMVIEKLNGVLSKVSSKSYTCFVNPQTGGGIVEDVLTKDITISFNYRSQTLDEYISEQLVKLKNGIIKLFYDMEDPVCPTHYAPQEGYVDFTQPTISPIDTNYNYTGNFIEIKVVVTISMYHSKKQDAPAGAAPATSKGDDAQSKKSSKKRS